MPDRPDPGAHTWAVGDRADYVLPRSPSNGRMEDWHCAATIMKVTKRCVVIRLDRWPQRTRNTTAANLRPFSELCS